MDTRCIPAAALAWAFAHRDARIRPEHRPVVDLLAYAVPPECWLSTGQALAPVLLVYPWQAEHVLGAYPWLRPTGVRIPARPLMSPRTLAAVHDPGVHLKTALDVQMTSAVRTGPALLARLAAATTHGLEILRELSGGAVLVNGRPCRSLAYLRRQAPGIRPGEVALPLAALAASSPADGRPLIAKVVTLGYAGDPVAFFDDLARLMLAPLLRLLHTGVALAAHGQNTLLILRDGRPAGPPWA